MIIDIEKSNLPRFRYLLTMDNGKRFYFGDPKKITYLDGAPKTKRNSYYRSLKFKPITYQLVKKLVPHRKLFEARLLWGPYRDIRKNIAFLNKLWLSKKLKRTTLRQ